MRARLHAIVVGNASRYFPDILLIAGSVPEDVAAACGAEVSRPPICADVLRRSFIELRWLNRIVRDTKQTTRMPFGIAMAKRQLEIPGSGGSRDDIL